MAHALTRGLILPGLIFAGIFLFAPAFDKQGFTTTSSLSLEDKACGFVSEIPGQTITCYWFHPKSGGIKLPVAVFSKKPSSSHKQEALIYIPGGPGEGGQNSVDNLEFWSYWYQNSGLDRDFVVFTPRGTPGSHPYWSCSQYDITSMRLAAQNLSFEDETLAASAVLQECLAEFNRWLMAYTGGGVEQFSTRQQADDVLWLVKALAYRRWHVWGVSYGSRVALKVAERSVVHGISPTSLLLDSVYPYTEGRQSYWAALQDDAMAIHGQYFAEIQGTEYNFSLVWEHANARLERLVRQAGETPLFTLENWYKQFAVLSYYTNQSDYHSLYGAQAQPFLFYLNDHRLLALMFFVLYDPNLLGEFYAALLGLESGNPEWQQPMEVVLTAFVNSSFDPNFSSMVFFAAECRDNQRETEPEYLQAQQQFQKWSNYLRVMRTYDVCSMSIFQSEGIGVEQLNLPNTLMLGGERDHVTPSDWAMALASRIEGEGGKVRFYQVPKAGHSVILGDWCSADIIKAWLDTSQQQPGLFEPSQYCEGE